MGELHPATIPILVALIMMIHLFIGIGVRRLFAQLGHVAGTSVMTALFWPIVVLIVVVEPEFLTDRRWFRHSSGG